MSERKDITVNDAQDSSAGDEEYEELDEDEETEEDVFNIPSKPTVESLKRWRQATFALNAARRFRYTLDLKAKKKEEEAREMLRLARDDAIPTASLKRQLSKFRTGTHVLRAVYRFREAGARARAGKFQTPPEGFGLAPDHLAHIVQNGEIDKLQSSGGVPGIAKALNSDLENGIKDDPDELQKRWDGFGENKYAKKKNKSFLVFLWEACQDTTLIILMVCAAVALATGIKTEGAKKGWYDGAAIGFAVLIVILVTAISDYRQSLQFRSLNAEKENIQIQVIRGGRRVQISIFKIAVGDVVNLNIGDQVPADGLFISGHSLTVDESSMTGESEPVHKDSKRPFLMGGCKVVDGHGSMLVTGVGMYTEWGQVMATLSEDNSEETPLQVRLNGAATFIGQIGLSVALLVFIILFIRYFVLDYKDDKGNGSKIADRIVRIFTIAVTIVVVAVPEGLPLAVTLTLAYSMRKMMADKSLVRKLAACETMGSATTICSDKTGTLTLNQMTVVKSWVAGDMRELDEVKVLSPKVFSAVVDGIALNTVGDVFLPEGGGEPEVSGSPTESACLSWGLKIGMLFDHLRSRSKILQVETFNSAKKRAGVAAKLEDGTIRVFWKGAAEIILEESTSWLDDKGTIQQLTPVKVTEIGNVIEGMAAGSLRCVAFAYRDLDPTEVPTNVDELSSWRIPEGNLTFVVVVGIKDPCRPGVREAVAVCQAAGVKVRMVTGDNIITAKAIAQECGILTSDGIVIEGREFRNLTEEEFKEILPKLDVMARSSPTDKLLLVKKLKEESNNSVVAVTGDGTNDAPALHEADIGLSMGISGTEVAKEASDIIILDDNFASVVKVVRWGRSVYANIQKFIQFQLTVNVTALVINFVAACSSGEVPLNAVQLLWVNLIMDTLGALALATEPPTDELMQRKPVGRKDALITNVMWRNLFAQAAYQIILLLTMNFSGKDLFNIDESTVEESDRHRNTIIFNTFVFCQVFNEFNARKPDKINVFKGLLKNRLFMGIIFISVVFQVVLVQLLGDFADTNTLSWQEWLICIALGSVSLPLAALFKLIPVREKPWFQTQNMFKRKKRIPRKPSGTGISTRKSSKYSSSKSGLRADGAKDELIPARENGQTAVSGYSEV